MNFSKNVLFLSVLLSLASLALARDINDVVKTVQERNTDELPVFIDSIQQHQPFYRVVPVPTDKNATVTSATIKFPNEHERNIVISKTKSNVTAMVRDINKQGVPSTRRYEGTQAEELNRAIRLYGREQN